MRKKSFLFTTFSLIIFLMCMINTNIITAKGLEDKTPPIIEGPSFIEINYGEYETALEIIENFFIFYDDVDQDNVKYGLCGAFKMKQIDIEQNLPIFCADQSNNFSFLYPKVIIHYKLNPIINGPDSLEFIQGNNITIEEIISTKFSYYSPSDIDVGINVNILKDEYSAHKFEVGNYKIEFEVRDKYDNFTIKSFNIIIKSNIVDSAYIDPSTLDFEKNMVPLENYNFEWIEKEARIEYISSSISIEYGKVSSLGELESHLYNEEIIPFYKYIEMHLIDENIVNNKFVTGNYRVVYALLDQNNITFEYTININIKAQKLSLLDQIKKFIFKLFNKFM